MGQIGILDDTVSLDTISGHSLESTLGVLGLSAGFEPHLSYPLTVGIFDESLTFLGLCPYLYNRSSA